MSRILFRPIDQWPGARLTPHRNRRSSPFTELWTTLTADLERELTHLGSHEVVIQIACDERAMRLDGGLRAGANPDHPGVIVSFESKHGPLRYHDDSYDAWKGNLRAISLTLTALRAIDRYGATVGGQQYRGWNALPPGRPMGAAMTFEQAERMLLDAANWPGRLASPESIMSAWRAAAKKHHPDYGGNPDVFRRLAEAKDLLIAR